MIKMVAKLFWLIRNSGTAHFLDHFATLDTGRGESTTAGFFVDTVCLFVSSISIAKAPKKQMNSLVFFSLYSSLLCLDTLTAARGHPSIFDFFVHCTNVENDQFLSGGSRHLGLDDILLMKVSNPFIVLKLYRNLRFSRSFEYYLIKNAYGNV